MAIRQSGLGRQKRWQFPKQQSASHQAWSSDKAPYGQSLLLLPPTLGSSTTNSHVAKRRYAHLTGVLRLPPCYCRIAPPQYHRELAARLGGPVGRMVLPPAQL